eukprot:scaffold70388_cov63-Phaeocystis_antarctica.AAC.2
MLSAHVGSQRRRQGQNGSSRPQSVLRPCEAAEGASGREQRRAQLSAIDALDQKGHGEGQHAPG